MSAALDPARARGGGPTVLWICSNETHVRTFVPVARLLALQGVDNRFAALDAWYGGRSKAVGWDLGVDVTLLSPHRPTGGTSFYRRFALAIWREVLAARPVVNRLVDNHPGAVVVAGNDFGLLEKLVLHTARSLRHRIVLVQDGRLAEARPRQPTRASAFYQSVKQLVSPLIRRAGFPYLAASEYGEFGADVVCATGPESATLLAARAARARRASRVIVTGQPRYDALIPLLDRGLPDTPTVTLFTTPFAVDGLGKVAQERQEQLVGRLGELLSMRGVKFVVKLHPRDEPAAYIRLIGAAAIASGTAAEAIASSTALVVGISSVIEEAALLRRPIVVPGLFVHGRRFENRLPDPVIYPRYESAEEMADALLRLTDRAGLHVAAEQAAAIADGIAFDPAQTAAARVADAVRSALRAAQ